MESFYHQTTVRAWTAVNAGLTNNIVLSLAVNDNNIFAGTFGGGVFLSTDNGTSWSAVNAGLKNEYIYSLLLLAIIYCGNLWWRCVETPPFEKLLRS